MKIVSMSVCIFVTTFLTDVKNLYGDLASG